MAQPRQSGAYPLGGERRVRCTLQYSTPTTDSMGGRGEPTWTAFGTWWAKVTVVPIVPSETEAVQLFEVEGPYRVDLLNRFNSVNSVRVKAKTLTLKVFMVENPQLLNRTLIAYCANAANRQ